MIDRIYTKVSEIMRQISVVGEDLGVENALLNLRGNAHPYWIVVSYLILLIKRDSNHLDTPCPFMHYCEDCFLDGVFQNKGECSDAGSSCYSYREDLSTIDVLKLINYSHNEKMNGEIKETWGEGIEERLERAMNDIFKDTSNLCCHISPGRIKIYWKKGNK